MRRLKRTIQKTTARLVSSACVLGLLTGLACGQALAQDTKDQPAPAPKAAGTGHAAQAKQRKPKQASAQTLTALLEESENASPMQSGQRGDSIKEFTPGVKQNGSRRPASSSLSPEFRPAVDTLTPSDSVAREPKTYDRLTPGVSAIIHPGKDTEIQGVFNLPEPKVGSMRPYGQPEGGAKSAASGGVMLKKSF